MITLSEITAKVSPAILASKDPQAIADAFNVGRTRVEQRLGGVGLILATLGADAGAALLDQLEAAATTVPALKWAFILINRGELDFGDSVTRASLGIYVPALVAEALKATAEVPDPVSLQEITVALIDDFGVWRY